MKPFLIVGLGNPGKEYEHTRHNIGFDIADAFAKKHDCRFETQRLAEVAACSMRGRKIYIIKPTTYMNLSGKAVRYWVNELKIELPHLLVLVDEMALPLGKIRINPKGSDGGHNGLKDIQFHLHTQEYPRLRFGIDKRFTKGNSARYVLSPWSDDEIEAVKESIQKCVHALECFIFEGIEKCMNTFNK